LFLRGLAFTRVPVTRTVLEEIPAARKS
jgi:hypothetical protein